MFMRINTQTKESQAITDSRVVTVKIQHSLINLPKMTINLGWMIPELDIFILKQMT